MGEPREAGCSGARSGFGGFTLLLALTLSLHAAAVASVAPIQSPALLGAVARFMATVSAETKAPQEVTAEYSHMNGSMHGRCVPKPVVLHREAINFVLLSLLDLPPPAGA